MSTVSPLLQRTYAQPLTLELLAEKVPIVKEGHEALNELKTLEKPSITSSPMEERVAYNELLKKKRRGSQAQDELITSALPLIKSLASKEYNRRKAWASRIAYDDILQEAIAGFIRGLLSYKPTNTQNSATNYLGQWIVTTIRRKLESMEHDFSIPYELVERNRRIVAVKSRLTTEMQREPSDAELLAALNDTSQQPVNKWGRRETATTEEPAEKKSKFTQDHLDMSKQLNPKLYSMKSNDVTESDDDNQLYERSSTTLSASEPTNVDEIDERSLTESKYNFFMSAFVAMKVGSQQKDIILRFWGLRPYNEPQSYKEIAESTGLQLRFVKNVLMALSTYMPTPGGVFHYQLLRLDETLVVDLELEWLLTRLGEWPAGLREPKQAPNALVNAR